MALTFSSTKPDCFDTFAIANEKWNQINGGNKKNVNVTGTRIVSPTTDDVGDTKEITLEKILQTLE